MYLIVVWWSSDWVQPMSCSQMGLIYGGHAVNTGLLIYSFLYVLEKRCKRKSHWGSTPVRYM